jgi:chromate transporter
MIGSLKLCLTCLKIGALVFGGGMVMIPLMEADVVDRNDWLTDDQFVDAVAMGQMTPGPLLVTATFVGWKVGGEEAGPVGALVVATLATACIFLPGFVMTIGVSNRLQRIEKNRWVKSFLWGVKAGVIGLIVGAVASIATTSFGGSLATADRVQSGILLALALFVLLRTKVDAGIVVVGCGLVAFASWGVQALLLGG